MAPFRNCRSCGLVLAQGNRSDLCARCQRQASKALDAAPNVPPGFWESDLFVEGFAAQHIGWICRAYRQHPYHHALFGPHGIPQDVVAGWLGLTQAQVSRVENGPPVRNLDSLVHWVLTLRIPSSRLWFDLPSSEIDVLMAPPPEVTAQHERVDSAVAVSQHEWRLTRRHLNGHRSELARAAVALYRSDQRVPGTCLLTCPEWMPSRPAELAKVSLTWRDDRVPVAIDGTEPQADPLRPLRSQHYRYDSYTSAIRYVDPPSLFENRPSYRLLGVSWEGEHGTLTFGLATYFDKLDIAEAIGHELAKASIEATIVGGGHDQVGWDHLPFRRLVGDLFDLETRVVVPAITTLTLLRDPVEGDAAFILHWRDPARVATAGGQYDVIPAGEFQPSSVTPWALSSDLDLWRNVVREYSEELCGTPEHDGSRGLPLDYDRWPFYRAMTRARDNGRIRAYCFGVGLDALTLAATIPTVVVMDHDAFAEIFGDIVRSNAEGFTVTSLDGQRAVTGIPFTKENVHRFLDVEPMAPPGAACLTLSWQHREMLLG